MSVKKNGRSARKENGSKILAKMGKKEQVDVKKKV